MLDKAKIVTSLVILFLGLAITARSILATGASLTVGVVAGVAFIIYGAARLYYARKAS